MGGFLLAPKRKFRLETERMILRLPEHADYRGWSALRVASAGFLTPWEPTWAEDHLSRRAFTGRVQWAARMRTQGTGLPLFLFRRSDSQILGAITLDNIRRGPAQSGTVGYWIGQPFARNGYMREALRALDLESLAGRPLTEIFVGLADYVCPGAGTVDEGIAREAYIETIVELASEGLTDLTTFTPDQMQTVFELYATHAIEARICNDIGTKAVTMPADTQAAHRVEQQLRDFIRGGVSDALTRARAETPNLTSERIQGFVDAVYESAFAILQAMGDAEADQ